MTRWMKAGLLVLLTTPLGCAGGLEPGSSAPTLLPSGGATAVPSAPDPTQAPASPTAVPPTEAPTSVSASEGLVIHLTTCGHTGCFGPGTTILEDGRIIWSDNWERPIESRLTPEALATVQAKLESIDALHANGTYVAELRPGAEPFGHGVNSFGFDLVRDGERITVSAWDVGSFEGEEELWVIPREMHELTRLAHRLVDPTAWLGPDAFEEPIRPYRAEWFLVEIHLYRGVGGSIPDVDSVRWPFGEPIESLGVPYEAGGDPDSRCLLVDATTAALAVEAELSAGVQREVRYWSSEIEYEWPRVGGSVTVKLTHLLPYESGNCAELATSLP